MQTFKFLLPSARNSWIRTKFSHSKNETQQGKGTDLTAEKKRSKYLYTLHLLMQPIEDTKVCKETNKGKKERQESLHGPLLAQVSSGEERLQNHLQLVRSLLEAIRCVGWQRRVSTWAFLGHSITADHRHQWYLNCESAGQTTGNVCRKATDTSSLLLVRSVPEGKVKILLYYDKEKLVSCPNPISDILT